MKKSLKKNETEKIRLDKWLWAARFFKTRALALKAISQGKVRYNGQKPNASRDVKIDAILIIELNNDEKTVIVKALSTQRQSALIAQTLYDETADSILKRAQKAHINHEQKLLHQSAPKPLKKPDKMARRKMRSLRRQNESGEP